MTVVTVTFLGPIGLADRHLEASTLADVAHALQNDDEVRPWLTSCAVAINDTMTGDLATPLKNGDIISLLPPVCGG